MTDTPDPLDQVPPLIEQAQAERDADAVTMAEDLATIAADAAVMDADAATIATQRSTIATQAARIAELEGGPDPDPTPGRVLIHGPGNMLRLTTSKGGRLAGPDVVAPCGWATANMEKSGTDAQILQRLGGFFVNQRGMAHTVWDSVLAGRGGQSHLRRVQLPENGGVGPAHVLTITATWTEPRHNAKVTSKTLGSNNIRSAFAMARVIRGDFAAGYDAAAAGAAAICDAGETVYLRPGSESSGSWWPWFSGVDLTFVANPVFRAALLSATDDEWGAAGPLLRQLGVDGDRGPMFAAIFNMIAAKMHAADERILCVLNFADSGAEPSDSDPDLPGYELSRGINFDGIIPHLELAHVDAVGLDLYCRNHGAPELIPGEPAGNPNSYTTKGMDAAFADITRLQTMTGGKPVVLPEVGFSFKADPTLGGSGKPDACNARFAERLFHPDTGYVNGCDLAMMMLWFATEIAQNQRHVPNSGDKLTWAGISEYWPGWATAPDTFAAAP